MGVGASPPGSGVTRDEVMAALTATGEDPTANRVDAVHAIVAAMALSEGDRGAGIRDAVERARCELEALGPEQAASSTVAGMAHGEVADAVGLDTVGQRIAFARKQAKLSQKAIADRLGFGVSAYNTPTERRWGIVGATEDGRVLFVVFTRRRSAIRVLQARDADPKYKRRYRRQK